MSRKEILARAADLMDRRAGCFEFIDGMMEAGIRVKPRFGSAGRVTLSFTSLDGTRMSEGDLRHGVGHLFYRSHTSHDPVLVELGKHILAGGEQPRLLDDAGEIMFGLRAAPRIERGNEQQDIRISVALQLAIDHANKDHSRAIYLPAMLDHLTIKSRDTLMHDLAIELEPDRATIMDMPENHGAALLRWFARGLDWEPALARQAAMLARADPEIDESMDFR